MRAHILRDCYRCCAVDASFAYVDLDDDGEQGVFGLGNTPPSWSWTHLVEFRTHERAWIYIVGNLRKEHGSIIHQRGVWRS